MLARKYRFHGLKSLNRVYSGAKTTRSKNISLKSAVNKRTTSRVAVVVSKKVEKTAVGRNRIRRRIYEITRQLLPELNEPNDIIISVFSNEFSSIDHQKLTYLLTDLFKKANLIK